ncbi:MAG: GGDEF domain-containing protein [Pseudomonadales bacterium]|nr:GGDEF domain-containing protein [Pseudomonadales bacterium]
MMYSHQRQKRLPIADPALKHEFIDVLQRGFYYLIFPRFLEKYFLQHYRDTALKNLKINSIYVVLTYLLLGGLVLGQFDKDQLGNFTSSYLLTGGCVVLVILLSRFEKLSPYFHWYTGILATIGLSCVMNVAHTITDPQVKLAAYAGSIYAIIVIYAMSKMRFYVATFWCHLAGVIHLLSLNLQSANEPFASFQAYFIAANLIGMGISYLIEHRERAMFIQSLLLDIDKIEQEKLNRDLEKLTREDSLTGLANRRYFDERLSQEWSRCMRDNKPLSVILFDVDYFKQFNDCYGHQAGDHCLVQIAKALKKEASRTGELVGRYGGEEFIILYPNTDADQIQVSLQRIRQRIHDLHIVHEDSKASHEVTASMGAATTIPVKSLHPDKLVSAADQMLYKAKGEGRDCWFNTRISHCEPQPSQLTILPFDSKA